MTASHLSELSRLRRTLQRLAFIVAIAVTPGLCDCSYCQDDCGKTHDLVVEGVEQPLSLSLDNPSVIDDDLEVVPGAVESTPSILEAEVRRFDRVDSGLGYLILVPIEHRTEGQCADLDGFERPTTPAELEEAPQGAHVCLEGTLRMCVVCTDEGCEFPL